MNPAERIIVALDRSRREEILALVESLLGRVGLFKLGLEAFIANGPSIVRDVSAAGGRVFLDLKLHDIPNTVAKATAAAGELGAAMLTLHAAGGTAMIRAAAAVETRPLLLGVTMLTSLGDHDIEEIGLTGGAAPNAQRLARLAQGSGADGCIASPKEIGIIREACGPGFLIVTPGIRGRDDDRGDQQRTMSAAEAIRAGADYIVVGRPITESPDPRAAAERIVDTL
ncbi:MAG TPA: orotidine-5'-phosphate decarboxylase [Thermoanaerobaculia bacterium]|nr:orotidine-5'-phosphate decarboxylase [Thermoanaerobaculia bacterium]